MIVSDIDFLKELNSRKPTRRPTGKISEYIQGKRLMPTSTPFPGLWDNWRTPYLVEIMDNMGPASWIQHQSIMKSAQLGLTAAMENAIAYWMDESPTEIMYISATSDLLEKWVNKRLDPMLESCGIKVGFQLEIKSSRRTGDKLFSKQFPGGSLDMVSAQSPSSLRSDSKRVLFRDEIDGAPVMLVTGEGNFLAVSFARTNAFSYRRKVWDQSTPTTYEASAIYQQYMDGDQRNFFVPCPHCGKFQVLKWTDEKSAYGIRADTEAGEIKQVYYLCEFCHEPIYNHQKTQMLKSGEWRPTAKSNSKYYRSYHINALYAPVGMQSFRELYDRFLEAKEDQDGMRSFRNLYEGLPFKEDAYRPPLESIIELRGEYKAETVPDGVIFLTAGIDVQEGNKKDPDHPPRLEMEVCGHGLGYRTWSIDYKVFKGDIKDEYSGAWKKLTDWVDKHKFGYYSKDGKFFPVMITFIDSGFLTDVVYSFTSRWESTYPSKGIGFLKKDRHKTGDTRTEYNFRNYRKALVANKSVTLYEIATNYYKSIVYSNLNIKRNDYPPQPARLCSFPIDYGSNYFKMLRAEEKRADGSFHDFHRRNEALDCRVMNLCAAQVFLDSWVFELREYVRKNGGSLDQISAIRSDTILEMRPWENDK